MTNPFIPISELLGPEGRLVLVAALGGAATRGLKGYFPKWLVPWLATLFCVGISMGIGIASGDALDSSIRIGFVAGSISIGSNELVKRLLRRLIGREAATAVLGAGLESDEDAPAK